MTGFRPTVRLRLTILYGGLFVLAGAVLLSVNYALVRRSLPAVEEAPAGVDLGGLDSNLSALIPERHEFITPDGQRATDVLRGIEDDLRARALHELVVQSSVALGLMAVVSVGLGWMVAGRALRPIQQVTAAARRLSESNLHERLALAGPDDEIKELADTFDAMLERLESAFDSQRRFVSNASHELRTPLSIQRTVLDVALADPDASLDELRIMAGSVSDAVDRSQHLIDGLLVLARSEQGVTEREPVDLAEVVTHALDLTAGDTGENGGLRIERTLAPAPVSGNRVLLERLVENLVQNGVRHNRPGGWLAVASGRHGDAAVVEVRNSGPEIPPGEVDGLFEPFRRLAPERTASSQGTGLGLSIVRAVARAHGGSIRAEAQDGGGLRVVVELPADASATSGETARSATPD